ncbi:pyridoxamine 5'-phosphate oxidase [Streptomyces albireticuli]|uniref:pyridoxamine 5'-phosphate oxidase n=1 Tax=Streptomyces albireticuli TaxID=1940 RepID=UPI000B4510BA|nr:pyridoxamine 5'-phosphate oxidase [Streptomyces albireticuli]
MSETESRVPREILAALDAHTTMTLAYVDEDGPQACAVLYAVAEPGPGPGGEGEDETGGVHPEGPALLFVTSATTRHGRALLAGDGRAAFTAQREGQVWTALTGMQGRGACRRLEGAEREAHWRAYATRFPYVERNDRLRQAMERTDLWELRPDWLRLIDNGQGFGHKTEWTRP